MQARAAPLLALALGVSGAAAASTAPRPFHLHGAGANVVDIRTGEVREHWTGRATAFGRIAAQVDGWIERPTPTTLTFRGVLVGVARNGDVLVAACTGGGVVPEPDGHEDWICDVTGGTGRFRRSRGRWSQHIVLTRTGFAGSTQHNRVRVRGAGRISWG